MSPSRRLAVFFFRVLPTGVLSRLVGRIARLPVPWPALRAVIAWYSRAYGVKTDEIPEGMRFRTFDEFFTRPLKKGVRAVDGGKNAIVSPVDAAVGQYGHVDGGTLLQAKGIAYSLADFIPSGNHRFFSAGSYLTLYLAPGDYHRIHSPADGEVTGYDAVPGRLLTVQDFMVRGYPGLFAKNERLITYIKSPGGMVAVGKVGATNVGRITISFDAVETNRPFRKRREFHFPEHARPRVRRGDELGVFHLGSTVVLLFQSRVEFEDLPAGGKVRMGQRIARFLET
jgi:phosphatidylserine decarboxylase